MAGWRRAVELAISGEEIETLMALSRSRTEPASRVSRAAMLLAYREHPSFFAVGQRLGVHHQTVERCVERAVAYGPLAAAPRPGGRATDRPERHPPIEPGPELDAIWPCPWDSHVKQDVRCGGHSYCS